MLGYVIILQILEGILNMRVYAEAKEAKEAYQLVKKLQTYFVDRLNEVSTKLGGKKECTAIEWERDKGRHGGGVRYETRDDTLFNRGSVNISQVHYDDDIDKKLSSATAISTIIHPSNPHAPSMHMHISWTQMRDGKGYWRIMADLNPSLKNDTFKRKFKEALKVSTDTYYKEGQEQGDKYFYIPALARTRGVSHFYLENFNTGYFEVDKTFAYQIGISVIDTYINIIMQAIKDHPTSTSQEKSLQLDYHTLYLFQVLTLDRGTTSGLLVHDQNDVGIMGSIPSHVNRELLASWISKVSKPQDALLLALLEALPDELPTPVEDETKKKLAHAVRVHYKKYPKALDMQASGQTIPTTVDNHN